MNILSAKGKISVSSENQKPGWYYLKIDNDFSSYYAWFYQATVRWKLPLNGCHITFIAGEKEVKIINPSLVSRLGEEVYFFYKPIVITEGRSFWINAECPVLDDIRSSLGLAPKWKGYHITLGNIKNKNHKKVNYEK